MLFVACLSSLPDSPTLVRNLVADLAMNPRQPTSTANNSQSQPLSWHCVTRSSYLVSFLSCAYERFSSQGTVNSISISAFSLSDQTIKSGLWFVITICCGMLSCSVRSHLTCHSPLFINPFLRNIFSRASPPALAYSHFSVTYLHNTFRTWLCLYVYLPRLCWQFDSIWRSVPLAEHSAHLEFLVKFQHSRFAGVGS